MSHIEDPDEAKAVKHALERIAPSFSEIHQRLLDLVIKKCSPDEELLTPIPPTGPLTSKHLDSMRIMVELEFLESLNKELLDPDEKSLADPMPFDIFVMESSLFRLSNDLQQQLAICVPMRKEKGSEAHKAMMWYDGRGGLWKMNNPQTHRWKVASLSGVVRTLESLVNHRPTFMQFAMSRQGIMDSVDVPLDETLLTSCLNDSQQEAVSVALSQEFTDGIFCVLGPPGCGKTHTINKMIEGIGEGLIVSAPSNAAVANVALKVQQSSNYSLKDIIVFGQNCDDSVRFLNPLHRSAEFYEFMKSYNKIKDNDAKDRKITEFARWLKLEDEAPDITSLARLCPYIDMEERSGRHLFVDLLRDASVIFCTLNSSGSNMLRNAIGSSFHTYILDEAGQCTESEFYIATTFPGICRMIVVGDPKQLPSTVLSQTCSQLGYGVSWLARTYNQMPSKVHMLNVQYRMDKTILDFPNSQFYSKQIMSGDNVFGREPFVSKPNLFVDTIGRGREAKNQSSWMNEYEAVVIKSLIHTDDDIVKLRSSPSNTRTLIITPYRAQASHLTDQLKKLKGIEVSTVDSVQGQEADIVIISTVRTDRVGFSDNAQRLNVALTRAKRVLRVVGDYQFFASLKRASSTLKSLAKYYQVHKLTSVTNVKSIAWTSPNWSSRCHWIPTMTSKFHDCIKNWNSHDKNVCFNTLLALSKPNLELIIPRPSRRERPFWYMSSLRGYNHKICVVWIAKCRGSDLLIEAHFAGTRHNCNNFIQRHVKLPPGACIVSPDLSGVQKMDCNEDEHEISNIFLAWPLTNPLQNAIMSCTITSLPHGNLVLDPHQQEISVSPPPLLIESRSGTGKTNVLFQHAVIHTQLEQQQHPGCFVTVSPRLCNELRQRYQELRTIQDGDIPDFLFYSRTTLLGGLLAQFHIRGVDVENLCNFREYCKERASTSHLRMMVEERLVENEIGGVITGSLAAALKKRPLDRFEYLAEIRSNISNKTDIGKTKRNAVYDVFEHYQLWKIKRHSFDINDVVLLLLKEPNLTQLFDSAYIDECQDFSYASLILICKVGGYEKIKWIFAGDTAQMISPGCSFSFAGLKQTLLSLQSGIESRLSKVNHLLVNYRTTRDVLLLGNAILSVAKKNFPLQIAHSQPEVAMKDLGMKICTCDLEEALSVSVKFGHNQAMIHSGDDSDAYRDGIVSVHKWLNDHPFILSSLDSKGLEFDDVVVYFKFPRNVWDTKSQREESLRILREMYVAVTRAKRRVVILIERKDSALRSFLSALECETECITDPKQFQVEFDCETSAELWNEKGFELFEEGRYDLAASCFASGNSWGLSNWAKGKHLRNDGDTQEAAAAFRRAAKYFVDECKYNWALDVLQELSHCPPWIPEDNLIFDRARSEAPTHIDRHNTLRIFLIADRWESITVHDLKNTDTSTLFVSYKDHPELLSMITNCSEEDRVEISKVLPSVIARYYDKNQNFTSAVKLYLSSNDIKSAEASTKRAVETARLNDEQVRGCISAWSEIAQAKRNLSNESYINLLIRLYESPGGIAASAGKKCIQTYGRKVILFAVEGANLEMTSLHEFDSNEFRTEVNKCLESKFDTCIDIVKWYTDKNDYLNANDYAKKRCKKVTDSEFSNILALGSQIQSEDLIHEAKRRKMVIGVICQVFLPQSRFEEAVDFANSELDHLNKQREEESDKLNELKRLTKTYDKKSNRSFSKLEDSSIFNFLDLCNDPYFVLSSKPQAIKCAKFGNDRILKAVTYGGPYEEDPWLVLCQFSSKHFRKLRRYGLLREFLKVGNMNTAAWYANFNREDWTYKEIINIVDDLELPFPIASELLRLGLAVEALKYALDLDDEQIAIEASSKLLESPAAAEENICYVLSAWKDKKPIMIGSPASLLRFGKKLIRNNSSDEMMALLINFGPSVVAFLKMNGLETPFDTNMLRTIIRHHVELRQHSSRLSEPAGSKNQGVDQDKPNIDISKSQGSNPFVVQGDVVESTTSTIGFQVNGAKGKRNRKNKQKRRK